MELKKKLIRGKMTIVFLLIIFAYFGGCEGYRTEFLQGMPNAGAVIGRQQPLLQQQQGCVWSTLNGNDNNGKNSTATLYPAFLQPPSRTNYGLECNVRTMNIDFWSNYTFNRNQLDTTSQFKVKCNDKLYFESVLDPRQSYFRLRNLQAVSMEACKIRKVPTRIFSSLGFLKTLNIASLNGDWSSAVGMEIESGAFEGLTSLEKLELGQNNIWGVDKNVFCPLKNLVRLNLSMNRLSDLEELGFGSSYRVGDDSSASSGSCALKIQSLDLSYNTLRKVNPNAFSGLRKLSQLNLQNNLISILEDNSFTYLNQLRMLNLSSNRLVALPPSTFPPNLREIILSNNSISALSPQIFTGLTSLLSLDLSRNLISSLPTRVFSGLTRIIILKLSHNQLTYIDASMFKDQTNMQALHLDNNMLETINPKAFENLKNLHSLDLSNNKITLIDSRHFSNLFLLRQLTLDHNKIREMDADCLKNCTNLQDVGLAGNDLTQVPVALRGLSHMVTLDIGENKIQTITNESFSGLTQLYGLRIVDNKLTELGWNFCAPLPKLRVLNVAQNRISKISPAAFTNCPELRALRVDANLLEELPPTLAPQLPSLLWLNASENRLKWADYKILPKTVEWLDLSHNMIETLGGPGGVVKDTVPYSLRVLDASYNMIGTLDYTAFPPTLETLRLNHNDIKSIASDTFRRATRLRRVELTGNMMEKISLETLRLEPLSMGKTIPEFFISGNPFLCSCENEWMTRTNQLSVLRQYPRIVDWNSITCRPTFPRYLGNVTTSASAPNQPATLSILDAKSSDFLCKYTSHCYPLCSCCEFLCDCYMQCPDGCNCYHDSSWSSNIVECSNSQHKDIPNRIPMDASELYLDGNELASLDSHIFIGKKNLRVLYLNGSQVEFIKNKTFNGLKSLEVLRLNDNKLAELNGWEFADVLNLRELFLQNNQIRHISPNTFSGLTFLSVLRLDGNFIVDYNVWKLSANSYLSSVMLANNPWSCDCEFLIPYRSWVASRTTIVVDFNSATCQASPVQEEPLFLVGSNSTKNFVENDDGGNNDKINDHQSPQLIINMCDHNKELNFNFNPNNSPDSSIPDSVPHLMESELLNSNHISAEKVASSDMNVLMDTINTNNNHKNNNHNNYNHHLTINDIPSEDHGKEEGSLWTIFTSVLITVIIVLLVILLLLFRKDHALIPFWLYSWCSSDEDDEDQEYGRSHHHNGSGFIPSLLACCCRGNRVGQSKKNGGLDDSDRLFDAYFLYSRKDEDLLLQKIAPELESPSTFGGNGILSHIPAGGNHGGNSNYYRLCLHYRDLHPSQNPLSSEMVLTACDASKRVVLLISRSFLQNEIGHPAIKEVINRYHNKIIYVLLPPLTEPEMKASFFSTMTSVLKGASSVEGITNQIESSCLEWSDKNFWSKFKLLLPTPVISTSASSPSGLNSTSTISSTGSSALFNLAHGHPHHNNLMNYNTSMGLHDYAYNTINSQHHQYHRNILPFQQLNSTNTPPVPKHHIALNQAWHQQQQQLQNQNFYNNSQHSQIIPIPGYPTTTHTVSAGVPLMLPNSYQTNPVSFNESFRRHLQLQQSHNRTLLPNGGIGIGAPPATTPSHQHHHSNCSSSSQGHLVHHPHHLNPHHHHHQGSHCSSSHSSSTSNNNPSLHPYQPLDANYSSSSSNEELLDHVYSTLDSPPIISNNNGGVGSSESANGTSSPNKMNMESETKGKNENLPMAPSQPQNRLNTNSVNNSLVSSSTTSNINNNNNNSSSAPPQSGNNNNGTMYFV